MNKMEQTTGTPLVRRVMRKTADFRVEDAVRLANPFITLAGFTPNTPGKLAEDPHWNRALWNALFSGGTMLAGGALIKYLSAKAQQHELDKVQRKAVESKLNGIVPVSTPNDTLEDTEEREKRRRRELSKEANILHSALASSLPIMAAGAGLYAGARGMDRIVTENRKEDLEREVAELQNRLDQLYNEQLQLRKRRDERRKGNVIKSASLEDVGMAVGRTRNAVSDFLFGSPADSTFPKRSILQGVMETPFIAAGMLSLLAAYASNRYFNKRDEDRAKVELMHKQILPANLTGIPPQIIVESTADGEVKVKGREGEKQKEGIVDAEIVEDPVR